MHAQCYIPLEEHLKVSLEVFFQKQNKIQMSNVIVNTDDTTTRNFKIEYWKSIPVFQMSSNQNTFNQLSNVNQR